MAGSVTWRVEPLEMNKQEDSKQESEENSLKKR